MASDVLSALNTRCDIYRAVQNTASSGATTTAYVITVKNAPCRFVTDSTDEAVRYQRETNRARVRFFLRPTLDVRGRDQIVFKARTFDVQGVTRVYDDATEQVAHIEVLAEETV